MTEIQKLQNKCVPREWAKLFHKSYLRSQNHNANSKH
jgi:hypothetical protein